MRHANFYIVEANAIQVVIADLGPHDVYPTVTNDVEHVVGQLLKCGTLQPGRRLLYDDGLGQRDEILWNAAGFVGFQPLGAMAKQ